MSKLSEYSEISSFNENTVLVRRGSSVYIKKRIPNEILYIYKILLNNHHKNISNVTEVFSYEDTAIIIEEYISGRTLADILKIYGTLSMKTTKSIIGQICDGLMFLHKNNIIHRDINPNNIIVENNGNVRIIDFDISRSTRKNASNDTEILGTVGYAAPEQFGFTQSGIRTDLYAVGVLANVMLTGKLPHEHICGGKPGRVIKKATSIDANARYASAAGFKRAFTGEVDENTNPALRVLRCIPGFRTWSLWKMISALILYAVYVPLIFLFFYWSSAPLYTLIGEIFIFGIPYTLFANIFNVRTKIFGNGLAAILAPAAISAVSFFAGSYFLSASIM